MTGFYFITSKNDRGKSPNFRVALKGYEQLKRSKTFFFKIMNIKNH